MKIGIDGRFYNESGVGRYLRNLISNLKTLDKDNQYFIFLSSKDFDRFEENNNFKKVLADFAWYGFAEQFKLPKLLEELKLDLVHFPHFNIPVFYKGKFVVTIHDLIHWHFNMSHATTHGPIVYKFKQLGYRRVFKHAIYKSQNIFTPSEYVKSQLVEEWNIKKERIIVTPEAVDDGLLVDGGNLPEGVKKPYIFFVGNAHPHKNVEGLIKAFLNLRKKHSQLKLVLAGKESYFWKQILEKYAEKEIIYLNFVPDDKLVALYKEAQAYIEPSFEEGFGIPVLEAMACGTPVVSSKNGSLKEVGGDSAFYFDPNDVTDMTSKISKVLENEKLRKDLIEKGLKRYRKFSWKKMAQQTLEVYEKCV